MVTLPRITKCTLSDKTKTNMSLRFHSHGLAWALHCLFALTHCTFCDIPLVYVLSRRHPIRFATGFSVKFVVLPCSTIRLPTSSPVLADGISRELVRFCRCSCELRNSSGNYSALARPHPWPPVTERWSIAFLTLKLPLVLAFSPRFGHFLGRRQVKTQRKLAQGHFSPSVFLGTIVETEAH